MGKDEKRVSRERVVGEREGERDSEEKEKASSLSSQPTGVVVEHPVSPVIPLPSHEGTR